MAEQDTSPLVKARRIKRMIHIQEINNPPSKLFDMTMSYPSDSLPEWFAPLASIVEDETFSSMDIVLGAGKVRYHIMIAPEQFPTSDDPIMCEACQTRAANKRCDGCGAFFCDVHYSSHLEYEAQEDVEHRRHGYGGE